MAARPRGLLAMTPSAFAAVFPADLTARLAAALSLVQPAPVEDLAAPVMAEVEVLVTGWLCPPLTPAVLDAAPRLRAVIHAAGSVKGHVGPEVFARGIAVSSAADANAAPVVDFTIAVITLAGKRAFALAREATAYSGLPPFGARPGNDERVIGVVGASRIGRGVIARLVAAGHRVLVADPYLDRSGALALGAELVELDDLCRRCDVVTLHAPALPETRHLLDERRLSLLPDGAIVINTARGSLADTDALTRACATGRLDACLDVTDPEPLPPGHPLLSLPNVWITPHLAGVQGSEVRRLGEFAVAEVERFVTGQPLHGAVHAAQFHQLA